ncbi:MAG: DUF4214 domain-containing protein [Gemmataceae bacterium]
MRRLLAFTFASILLSASLAQAQSYYHPVEAPGDPTVLVHSWYKRYLRREADAGANGWIQALRTGHSPEDVLSTVLSSQEYFTAAGRSNPGYVRQLYLDLIGRAPSPAEINYWTGRLRYESRKDVAYHMLVRHPQNWSGMKAPPPSYDPGYYPDPASPTFRDPSGAYFHSPYFYNYEYRRPIRAWMLDSRG